MRRLGIVAVGLAIVAVACQAVADSSRTNLEVGDCVVMSYKLGEIKIEELERQPCAPLRNLLQVTKKFEFSQEPWPGRVQMASRVSLVCPSGTVKTLSPTEESWKAGDREVVCSEYAK